MQGTSSDKLAWEGFKNFCCPVKLSMIDIYDFQSVKVAKMLIIMLPMCFHVKAVVISERK